MDGTAIMTVTAAVVGMVQLAKWSQVPTKYAPIVVFVFSAIGVVLWGWSMGTIERASTFDYFAGWIAVSMAAAGVFGFIREGRETVTAMKKD